jgi:hypothetical protein
VGHFVFILATFCMFEIMPKIKKKQEWHIFQLNEIALIMNRK